MSNISPISHGACLLSSRQSCFVRSAGFTDLTTVNLIIKSAVESWQVPDRLKRLSLPLLQYNTSDFEEFELFLHLQGDVADGVAALARDANFIGPHATRCALLHGLYVRSDSQRLGVGKAMQQIVTDHACEMGCEGLLVKAQRVSTSYFAKQGYTEYVSPEIDYPYLYWKPISQSQ